MTVCAQCGQEALAESNFCSRCGAPLTRSMRPSNYLQGPQTTNAERKLVSIVFADIVGSTSIVDGLDPEDALDELGPAIEVMKAAVRRFGGTLCREQGDGILAIFGAPKADDHHPVNASLAALEIVRAVEHLTHRKMKARAGIHSGEVLIRLIEGELGPSYDATGVAVHLASRLELIAQPGTVLVSAATYTLTVPYFDFLPGAPVIPKGFTQPIPVFTITGQRSISRWLARGGKDLSSFGGRDPEIERLRVIAQSVAEGKGQVALITGIAGAGKSRLSHEFIAGLAADGWSIIEAEAQPSGQATPYGVLKRIFLSWMGCSELDSPAILAASFEQRFNLAASSPHFISALRSVLDLPVDDIAWQEAEPGFRRRNVVDAIKIVISSTADTAPVVLLLEDLHWIDSDLATVINGLREILPERHLLILELPAQIPKYLSILDPCKIYLKLSALDASAATVLLNSLLGAGAGLAKLKGATAQKDGWCPAFHRRGGSTADRYGGADRIARRLYPHLIS